MIMRPNKGLKGPARLASLASSAPTVYARGMLPGGAAAPASAKTPRRHLSPSRYTAPNGTSVGARRVQPPDRFVPPAAARPGLQVRRAVRLL
jgi:hypothetical protein